MGKYRAVVFDWDGVLADTLWILEEIYRQLGPRFGVHEFVQGKDWFEVDWKEHWSKMGCADRLKEIQQAYLEIIKGFDPKTEMFPGTPEMIRELATKTTMTILTNNWEHSIRPILERHNIHNTFQFIYDASEPFTKPDPHVITLTAERLGISPAEMVFIGDMDKELEMAKKAGVGKIIGCAYGYHSEKRLAQAKPDLIVHSPQELRIALFEALHG